MNQIMNPLKYSPNWGRVLCYRYIWVVKSINECIDTVSKKVIARNKVFTLRNQTTVLQVKILEIWSGAKEHKPIMLLGPESKTFIKIKEEKKNRIHNKMP